MNYQVKSKQTWKAVSFCSITANGRVLGEGWALVVQNFKISTDVK